MPDFLEFTKQIRQRLRYAVFVVQPVRSYYVLQDVIPGSLSDIIVL